MTISECLIVDKCYSFWHMYRNLLFVVIEDSSWDSSYPELYTLIRNDYMLNIFEPNEVINI